MRDPNVVTRISSASWMGLLIAGILIVGAGSAAAKVRVRFDDDTTTRAVKRISVGPRGITIEPDGADPSSATSAHDVDDGHGSIRIIAEGDTDRVRRRVEVHGAKVTVDAGDAGLVRVFADAEVPAGESIEGDVVAVFGSVLVRGRVAGNVAAVFGSVHLAPGAVVDGDVVAVGGALDQAVGATVNGESVSLGLFSWHPGIPTLQVLLSAVFGSWAVTLFLGWLLVLVFPQRLRRVALTASQRTAGAFVLGVASAPLMVIAIVLLAITVVGIPFAVVLPLFYVFAVWAGQLATSYVLGCRLLRRPIGAANPIPALAAGTLFVASFFALGAILSGPEGAARTLALFLTLLGVLMILGLSVVGTGAVLLSRFGSRPRDLDSAPYDPPYAAPMPAMEPAPPIA